MCYYTLPQEEAKQTGCGCSVRVLRSTMVLLLAKLGTLTTRTLAPDEGSAQAVGTHEYTAAHGRHASVCLSVCLSLCLSVSLGYAWYFYARCASGTSTPTRTRGIQISADLSWQALLLLRCYYYRWPRTIAFTEVHLTRAPILHTSSKYTAP